MREITYITHNCKKLFEDLLFYLISSLKQQNITVLYTVHTVRTAYEIFLCFKLRREICIQACKELALAHWMRSPIKKLSGPQSAAALQLLLRQIQVCLRRAMTALERIFLAVLSQLQGLAVTTFNPLCVHSSWTTICFCSFSLHNTFYVPLSMTSNAVSDLL